MANTAHDSRDSLSRVTHEPLELQEDWVALHGPDHAACRALEAVLKPFFAAQHGSLLGDAVDSPSSS